MKKTLLLTVSIICLSLLGVSSKAQCGGLTPQPGSDWAVSSWGLSLDPYAPPSTPRVLISSFQICNMVTATPAWSSSNYICTFAAAYRPYSTKVITLFGNGGTGMILQGTVDPSGNFYVQYVSGPFPARGVVLTGSYYK